MGVSKIYLREANDQMEQLRILVEHFESVEIIKVEKDKSVLIRIKPPGGSLGRTLGEGLLG